MSAQRDEPSLLSELLAHQRGDMTIADLEDVNVVGGPKLELIDGWIYMSPPVGNQHQDLVYELTKLIDMHLGEGLMVRNGVSIYGQGIRNWVEPDIAIFDPASKIDDRGYDIAGVHLIVEITSPSNRADDLVTKRQHFERHRVPYIVIDRFAQTPQALFIGTMPDYGGLVRAEISSQRLGAFAIEDIPDYV